MGAAASSVKVPETPGRNVFLRHTHTDSGSEKT